MRNLENLEGDALDRVFLEDMIPHHMTAVMMSQQLLARGLAEHEQVTVLARNIRDSQRDEIHMMRRWLTSWYDEDPIAGGRNLPALIIGGLLLLLLVIMLVVLLIMLLTLKISARDLLLLKIGKPRTDAMQKGKFPEMNTWKYARTSPRALLQNILTNVKIVL